MHFFKLSSADFIPNFSEDVSYSLYQKEKKRMSHESEEEDDKESEQQEQRTRGISNLVEERNKENWNISLAISNLNKEVNNFIHSL